MTIKLTLAAMAALACAWATPATAQSAPETIVSIYRVAPGQHVAFLKWLNRQDQKAAAAGVAKGQLYIHTDGDSWDYVVISPQTTEAQDDAIDALTTKAGDNPRRGGLELRKMISSHTDTFTRGPTTAGDYLTFVGEK